MRPELDLILPGRQFLMIEIAVRTWLTIQPTVVPRNAYPPHGGPGTAPPRSASDHTVTGLPSLIDGAKHQFYAVDTFVLKRRTKT